MKKKKKMMMMMMIVLLGSPAFADNKTAPAPIPPKKVQREDRLDVENIGLRLDVLQRQATELVQHRNAILARYGIKPEELGVTVGWDENGNVQRKPAPVKK